MEICKECGNLKEVRGNLTNVRKHYENSYFSLKIFRECIDQPVLLNCGRHVDFATVFVELRGRCFNEVQLVMEAHTTIRSHSIVQIESIQCPYPASSSSSSPRRA